MSSGIDKGWISCDKIDSTTYKSGLLNFFNFLLQKDGAENVSANRNFFYSCPCRTCCNVKGKIRCDEIFTHLLQFGMDKSYTTWYYHGEELIANKTVNAPQPEPPIDCLGDEFDQTSFPTPNPVLNDDGCEGTGSSVLNASVSPEKKKESKYEQLKRLAQRPLYPSSQYSTMDALLKLNDLKYECNVSNVATEGFLRLLKELLPEENSLSSTFHELKCTLKEAELNCISYDVCVNNCMLFWKEHANSTHCAKCQEPRYKMIREETTRKKNNSTKGGKRKRSAVHEAKMKRVACKVMKYFPVIPRLKRLYGIKWVAEAMKWHDRAKTNVEFMRHPCDSTEWTRVSDDWESFALDPRSVRFALAIDGVQPYGKFGSSYSCWPVILQPLNLPPSLVMNAEFSMLTVLIPGKSSPKREEVDVFLQPLIEELNVLWKGVDDVWDADERIPFTLKAMILWCIHDFPAYGLLAGCATKGYYACPICFDNTPSMHLPCSKKCSFLRSRMFLPKDHPFRYDTSTETFNGEVEFEVSSPRLGGKHVERLTSKIGDIGSTSTLHGDDYDEGDDDEGTDSTKGFSRRSSLFDLPYWSSHTIRHNLDLMHIERNVTEIILNTILSMKGMKDTRGAREDLEHFGLKKSLWMKVGKDGKTKETTEAPYVLSSDEKTRFFKSLKTIIVPTTASSNFHVSVNAVSKTFSFKSHDYHVVMQHLLPALLMDAFPKSEMLLFTALRRISIFFNVLSAKVLSREHLNKAKLALTEALCVLEAYFPSSFFVSMIHLMHHLADEALIAGPPRFRSMWLFERQINKYKGWVRNKRYIEGSIAEAYLLYEASLYANEFKGTQKGNGGAFSNTEDPENWGQQVGLTVKTVLNTTQMVQARKWILQQQPDYDNWRREYDRTGRHTIQSSWKYEVDDFLIWLKSEAENKGDLQLQRICQGPDFNVDSYNQFKCNGYTFSTVAYDRNKLVQNSGVSTKAFNPNGVMTTYYGVIKGIFDLDYGDHSITIFYCDWVDSDDRTAFKVHPTSKLVMVNLRKTMPSDEINSEPFILASQARQVFYCDTSKEHEWSVVIPSPKGVTKDVDAIKVDRTMYNSMIEDNEWLCTLLEPIDGLPLKKKATRRRA